jgi:serine/threonine protein phosphatase PrpC
VNEDCFGITLPHEPLIAGPPLEHARREVPLDGGLVAFGVYDGCGGMQPADVASSMLAKLVHERFRSCQPRAELAQDLALALTEGSRAIYDRARSDPRARGMGTTATVAAIHDHRIAIAYAGDTRAYCLRGNVLHRWTDDDTLLRDLLRAGKLSPAEVEEFPHKGVIVKALGLTEHVEPTSAIHELEPFDRVMLCCDGITNDLEDAFLSEVLQRDSDPEDACSALIEAAERAGGTDNQTVVIIDWVRAGLPTRAESPRPTAAH